MTEIAARLLKQKNKGFAILLVLLLISIFPSFSPAEGVKGRVTSVLRDTIKLDIGTDDGIKVGDAGRVYYVIKIGEREKPIYIAKITVGEVQEKSSTARIGEKTGDVKVGFLVEVEVKAGSLSIHSEPAGATLLINGRSVGATPYEEADVPPVTVRIRMMKEGHEAWDGEVTVTLGKKTEVSAQLKKLPGGAKTIVWRDPVTEMEFVWIPGGCFEMGSPLSEKGRFPDEGPVHEVCVDGFWVGKHEVTNGQFRKFRIEHDSKSYQGYLLNGDHQPVVNVTWEDARTFADWLTKQHKGHNVFRLPREAEWEYVCRAGTKSSRYWGDDPEQACKHENIADQAAKRHWPHFLVHDCNDGHSVTAPVGKFPPNPFGLHDMLGNVMEWCEDVYHREAYSKHQQKNPVLTESGPFRVGRGGSWYYEPSNDRCAYRHSDSGANDRYPDQGFRLVMQP